jgi:hypothetical protein
MGSELEAEMLRGWTAMKAVEALVEYWDAVWTRGLHSKEAEAIRVKYEENKIFTKAVDNWYKKRIRR